MLRVLSLLFLVLLPTAGCGRTTVLGADPAGQPVPISELAKLPKGTPVVVAAEMDEKCPVAGCWFFLRDGTGRVRVDTKVAGWVVTEVPLHSRLTVAGKVEQTPAGPEVVAEGARY